MKRAILNAMLRSMGWLMVGAALAVAVGGGGYLFTAADLPSSDAALLFAGLLMPLGLQVAFGIFLLRQTE